MSSIRPVRSSLALVALSAGLLSCFETAPGSRGELGTGGFNYACTGWGDPVCEGRYGDGAWNGEPTGITMPVAIAVGGRFGVVFESDDARDFDPRTVTAASPDVLETRTVGFQALAPGWVALLARDAAGDVVDLTHVQIVEPARLAVLGVPPTMTLGQSADAEGQVRDRDGVVLAGALDYDWEVDNSGVLRVVAADSDPDSIYDDAVQIEAVAEGSATLTVTAGGLTESFEVTVNP